MKIQVVLTIIAVAACCPARAQPASAPSQEALSLARTLVEKSGAGGEQALTGLTLPIPDYLRELGVGSPLQARVLAHEVIMPALGDHSEDLTEMQVKSYAALLTVPEMKAAIAFFDSPAGQNFTKFRARRLQANLPEGAALIARLRPEIELRAQDVARAHGFKLPG